MAALAGLRCVTSMVQPGEKIMTSYSILKTSMGDLMLVANKTELVGIYFLKRRHVPATRKSWTLDTSHPVLKQAAKQIKEYLDGNRSSFSLPLASTGTDFQKRIWKQIARIPFGKTISYTDLAKRAGAPKAIRAAGAATGRNPLSIIVPCHRVLGKNNVLGGYAGGLKRKRHLLALESVRFEPR